MKNQDFWKTRSIGYDELEWVKDENYLDILVSVMKLKKTDFVLDVGTGTGIIAHHLSPLVKEVIGVDISKDMLDQARAKDNQYFFQWDIRNPIFKDAVFDKIIARMVFHHINKKIQQAVNECHRILKKGGMFAIAEGVPPTKRCKNLYVEIFKHKEDRLTFFESDLARLMQKADFGKINIYSYVQKGMSIKNWLAKSGLPKAKQKIIYDLHINAPDYFKKDYDMKIENNDCFVNFKNVIVVGIK